MLLTQAVAHLMPTHRFVQVLRKTSRARLDPCCGGYRSATFLSLKGAYQFRYAPHFSTHKLLLAHDSGVELADDPDDNSDEH